MENSASRPTIHSFSANYSMNRLASLSSYLFRRKSGNSHIHRYSSFGGKEELSIEEDAERKFGWILKLMFVGTATYVGFQFFPYMGDNLLQQSISLLQVKDPLFKRMGASRLSRFAVDDERRMKVVEMGGAQELLKMLEGSKDDRTRKQALKALLAVARSDAAAGALDEAGAIPIVNSAPVSLEDAEIGYYKSNLLQRLQNRKNDSNLSNEVLSG